MEAERIRSIIRARRQRERRLAPDLFADPAWDMLLDLAAARLERKRVAVSSLCIAAAVPPATAHRYLGILTDRGFIVREPDPDDRRRFYLTLSDAAAEAVNACLEGV